MAVLEPGDKFTHDTPRLSSYQSSEEMRNNLTALAQQHYTTDAAKPFDPRDGQPRVNASDPANVKLEVYLSGAWRTLLQRIGIGQAAPTSQIAQFDTALAAWTIDHNLGAQPTALVYDGQFRQLEAVSLADPRVDHMGFGHIPNLQNVPAGAQLLAAQTARFSGFVRGLYISVPDAITGAPDLSLEVLINGTPVVGANVVVNAPLARGVRVDGTTVTADDKFATGDLIELRAQVTTAPTLGALNAFLLIERNGFYYLQHVTEDRITVTHPEPRTGFVILVG
jgi:hypothetical protein